MENRREKKKTEQNRSDKEKANDRRIDGSVCNGRRPNGQHSVFRHILLPSFLPFLFFLLASFFFFFFLLGMNGQARQKAAEHLARAGADVGNRALVRRRRFVDQQSRQGPQAGSLAVAIVLHRESRVNPKHTPNDAHVPPGSPRSGT